MVSTKDSTIGDNLMLIKNGRRARLEALEKATKSVEDDSIMEIFVYRSNDELDAWQEAHPGRSAVFIPDNGRDHF